MPRLLKSLRTPTVGLQLPIIAAHVFAQSRMGLPLQTICTNMGVPWLSGFTLTNAYIVPHARFAWIFTLLFCVVTLIGALIMLLSLFFDQHTRSNLHAVSAVFMFVARTVL